ncbi:Ig-like domain-containing protein [Streptomyces sp. cg2]|uniref:Ig-like domain-containing protein n=1 Tax=Streptomyces sp. cg2 TaxID=3238799 RepID=UPI0034E1F45C
MTFQYGTSVTLDADTTSPRFGHAVHVTATVAPANPGAGAPTGSVTFSDGTTTPATMPLNGGRATLATFTTSKLQPGAHRITATYWRRPHLHGRCHGHAHRPHRRLQPAVLHGSRSTHRRPSQTPAASCCVPRDWPAKYRSCRGTSTGGLEG